MKLEVPKSFVTTEFLTDLSRFFHTFHSFHIEQLPLKARSCLLQSISLHVVKRNLLNVVTLLIEETFFALRGSI